FFFSRRRLHTRFDCDWSSDVCSSDLPHARYRVRSGPDGADLELLDVIWHEDVATRFSHIVIGSGDGTFVNAARALSDGGVWVTEIGRASCREGEGVCLGEVAY